MRQVDPEHLEPESTEAERLVFVVHGFVAKIEKRNDFLSVKLHLNRFELLKNNINDDQSTSG
jgi:hypothetical protein